jgi:HSP20 family protein
MLIEKAKPAATPLARAFPGEDLFLPFQDRVDRLFRDFFREGWVVPALSSAPAAPFREWPRVDVSCDAERVRVEAELPGIEEKDVKVVLDRGTLQITGERSEAKEDKGRNWTRRERTFGAFERVLPLPDDVVADKAEARFTKGVLTVEIPRRVDEKNRPRAIPVKAT